MIAQKRPPALRGGRLLFTIYWLRSSPYIDAELEQFAMDPAALPTVDWPAHGTDQLAIWSATLRSSPARPDLRRQYALKPWPDASDNGLRLDDRQGVPDIGNMWRADEYQPVEGVEAEPLRGGAAQHDDLLPQKPGFRLRAMRAIGITRSTRTQSVCRRPTSDHNITRFAGPRQLDDIYDRDTQPRCSRRVFLFLKKPAPTKCNFSVAASALTRSRKCEGSLLSIRVLDP